MNVKTTGTTRGPVRRQWQIYYQSDVQQGPTVNTRLIQSNFVYHNSRSNQNVLSLALYQGVSPSYCWQWFTGAYICNIWWCHQPYRATCFCGCVLWQRPSIDSAVSESPAISSTTTSRLLGTFLLCALIASSFLERRTIDVFVKTLRAAYISRIIPTTEHAVQKRSETETVVGYSFR